jgi:hypothetical protein
MTLRMHKYSRMFLVTAALGLCNGGVSNHGVSLVATAGAVIGAPLTPVSYAGVARRSTVGVGAPGVGVGAPGVGVGAPGVGVGAPGVGVTPAPGVNTPANRGGPVNRVGVR